MVVVCSPGTSNVSLIAWLYPTLHHGTPTAHYAVVNHTLRPTNSIKSFDLGSALCLHPMIQRRRQSRGTTRTTKKGLTEEAATPQHDRTEPNPNAFLG